MFNFPDTPGRVSDKRFCFSLESADNPYETFFPIMQIITPCLQPIRLAAEASIICRRSQWSNLLKFFNISSLRKPFCDMTASSKYARDKGLAQGPTVVKWKTIELLTTPLQAQHSNHYTTATLHLQITVFNLYELRILKRDASGVFEPSRFNHLG